MSRARHLTIGIYVLRWAAVDSRTIKNRPLGFRLKASEICAVDTHAARSDVCDISNSNLLTYSYKIDD